MLDKETGKHIGRQTDRQTHTQKDTQITGGAGAASLRFMCKYWELIRLTGWLRNLHTYMHAYVRHIYLHMHAYMHESWCTDKK